MLVPWNTDYVLIYKIESNSFITFSILLRVTTLCHVTDDSGTASVLGNKFRTLGYNIMLRRMFTISIQDGTGTSYSNHLC